MHYATLWPRGLARVRPELFFQPGVRFVAHARELAPGVDVRVLFPGQSTVVDP
jgi:hypothetical protein